jgi:Domain of Unknown Function (DUF928)
MFRYNLGCIKFSAKKFFVAFTVHGYVPQNVQVDRVLNQLFLHLNSPAMISIRPALIHVALLTTLGIGLDSFLSTEAKAGIPFNPPTSGAPTGRGGASRGDKTCSSNPVEFSRRFQSLTPINSNHGLTMRPRPTLFAYVPPSPASQVFFSLKDESGMTHYETFIPISKPGILEIKVPDSVRPLEVGKQYSWGVALLCSGELTPGTPFITSWIKRVVPSANVASALQKPASLEQAILYGSKGIWYDTLETLATLQKQQPSNTQIKANWKELLNLVGLGEISTEALPNS